MQTNQSLKKKFKINRLLVRSIVVTMTPVYFYVIVPNILRYCYLPASGMRNTSLYILLDAWYKIMLIAFPIILVGLVVRKWSKSLHEFEIRDSAKENYKYNLVQCYIIGDTLCFEHADGNEDAYDIGGITNLRRYQDDILFLYEEDLHRYTDYYRPSLYETLYDHWRGEEWEDYRDEYTTGNTV